MKKMFLVTLALAVCAWAADFWQSKPYTDWNEKEVQKVETNSPWAKFVSVAIGDGGGGGGDTGKGKRGKSGGGGGGDSDLMSGGAPGGGGNAHGVQEVPSGGGGPSVMVTVSWRTALPIREALAKEKYGKEAGTSPESKKLVEEDQKFYAVLVSGLPGRTIRNGDKLKEMLLKNSSLSVKGKDPIVPSDVQAGGNEQKAMVLFVFPKTTPIDLDDKEVEFSAKLGPLVVKQKFHLKDMVFNGKLEL